MTTAAATLLFLLIIAALVAVAVVAGVVLLLGTTAGLSTALAAFLEWRERRRPDRADPHRRGLLRSWASRKPALRWAAAKVAEVEGRDPVEAQRF
ncbi:hypothetical protein [Actinomycetospora sp. TBRC 11914]|uniref:hypothetical protein n=1 Tax=Actinomycetospora sp. TBRC 11914 TaxID=2729387 RepID=UPI00145DC9D0|nr:hypothetical protein [Actinomycetospora sp. TBRC 11914]NMO93164.1 hypothetical protein [Actinomycetospora sp. TBRC 11914]